MGVSATSTFMTDGPGRAGQPRRTKGIAARLAASISSGLGSGTSTKDAVDGVPIV